MAIDFVDEKRPVKMAAVFVGYSTGVSTKRKTNVERVGAVDLF